MNRLSEILSGFPQTRIMVVGDVMLDRYLEGKVTRINPEAPVPIVALEKEYSEPGGAANVAQNISSLGGSVSLFGFIGKDSEGEILKTSLKERGIPFYFEEEGMTCVKSRVMGNNQQLIRFDKEKISDRRFSDTLKSFLVQEAEKSDIIVVSDYAKGVVTGELMRLLTPFSKKIIADPKPKNRAFYNNILLITPNEKESLEMSSKGDYLSAGIHLKETLKCNVLITRSEKGMSLFSDKRMEIPTYAKEVYDVTGAGDVVISTIALALASGAQLEEASILANHAAGIALEKKGTSIVSLKELRDKIVLESGKIISSEELRERIREEKRRGRKVVWTNGCFDLLHVGHVRYLKEAKKLGDVLVVGINSDVSVKRLKGDSRPLQTENERAEIISSLQFVDYVIVFPEDTTERYILEIQPEIYVKGGDYNWNRIKDHPEGQALQKYGGEARFIQFVEGKSTTNLVKKMTGENNLQ